jgi:hypothetical protein
MRISWERSARHSHSQSWRTLRFALLKFAVMPSALPPFPVFDAKDKYSFVGLLLVSLSCLPTILYN